MGTTADITYQQQLLERCRKGDSKAQYQLYQQYAKAMFNLGLRITNNYADAEDVLQEAFVSAFRHLHHYRGEVSFGAWLKRIVVNKSINNLKRQRPFALSEELVPAEEPSGTDEGETAWQVERVRNAITRLPDGYRVVLTLYLLEGYDHTEIADIMQISEETSKSQYSRARKKLQQIIKNVEIENK